MTIFLKTRKLRQLLKFKYFNVLVVSLIASFILTLGILGSSGTDAASYDYINFQGKLTDQNGFGIVSQTKSITFCIFSASTGGSCSATPSGQLWYETKNVTTDARGIFNTALGDTTAFGTLFTNNSNNDLYLAVNVASDGEMTPRHAIGSVPKSFNSSRLEGSTWAAPGAIGTTTANSGSFTSLSASSMTISGLLVNGVVLSSSGNLISTALLNSSYGGTTWNSSSATGMVKVTSGTWSTATAGTDYVAGGVGTNHQVAFFTGAGVLSGSNNLYWDNSNVYLGVGGTPTAALHVQSSTTASYARIQGADDGDNYAALELWNSAATQKWQFALKSISGQTGDFNFVHYDGTSWSNPFTITNTGNVGIGTTSPAGRLHSYISNAAVTTSQYAGYFENLATNTTTDGINKYGLYINSTGSFTGSTGTATNNYGLYVAAPTGADNNYAAIFAGGNVGIGTSSPTRSLHLAQTTANTSSVSSPFLLNTISTGDMVDGFGGGIIFGINDNTLSTENIIATIYGIRDGADNSGALTASTYSSGTRYERLRITSAGNVGIGTTSPWAPLSVNGAIRTGTDSTNYGGMSWSSGLQVNTYNYASPITFNGGSLYLSSGSTGNVGIGTTTPGTKLEVYGTGKQANGVGIEGGELNIVDNTAMAAGVGGYVGFGGQYTSGGSYFSFARIGGIKESGTSADSNGALVFETQVAGAGKQEKMRITSSGNLGIGTTSPTGRLHSYISNSAVTTSQYTGYLENLATNTTTDGINKYGLYITSTGTFTGSTGTATKNYGLYVDTPTGADNNYAAYFGGNVGVGTANPGTRLLNVYSNGASNDVAFEANMLRTTGANYGIRALATGSGATTNYGLYVTASGASNNYAAVFDQGNVGIGVTSPTGKLHLAAGTATAGTAPLKFTAGTNLTSAEAGAVEWDGSRLYITQTTGPTRKTIAYTDDPAAIAIGSAITSATAGSVLYAGASGVLAQDNSNFYYDYTNHRLGLGTTSPSQILTINYDGHGLLHTNGTISLSTYVGLGGAWVGTESNHPLYFYTNDNATQAMAITTGNNVGIGTTSPTGRLHSYISNSAVTTSQYTGYLENLATNTTTDGINKYGLYITSTGTFTGSTGTATNNYGLYIASPTGADNNYSIYSAGGSNNFVGSIITYDTLYVADTTGEAVANIYNNTSDWEILAGTGTDKLVMREYGGNDILTITPSSVIVGEAATSLIPAQNNTAGYTVGTSSYRWKQGYFVDGIVTGSSSTTYAESGVSSTYAGALGITPTSGQNFNISLATTGDLTVNTDDLVVDTSAGNVGINTTGPDRRLDVLDTTNPQLRLTYTDNSVYTDFQTSSVGDLTITPTGDDTFFAGGGWAEVANATVTGAGGLRTGSSYGLTMQNYQNCGGDAFMFQNAYSIRGDCSGNAQTFNYISTHASFGERGIGFSYGSAAGKGITFYADTAATTADATFTPTARMVIQNNGAVGIGTTSPDALLDVVDGSIYQQGVGGISGYLADGGALSYSLNKASSNAYLSLYNSSSALTAHIGSGDDSYFTGGNVGIGTTTPNGNLTIFGSTAIGSGGTDGIGNILMQNNAVRSLGVGPSITFAPSINTGSVTNTYTQAEIIGAADNSTNANAAGQLRFRVKDYISSAWSWRDAMTIRASGSVGIGTAVPATNTTLDVNGMIRSSRLGFAGTYNSAEVQGIWSIGPAYLIDTTNDDFGTLYGMGYAYNQNGGSPFAGQHQIVFTNNGTINAAISLAGQAWFASTISASNLSGSNTGDQTITLTGDVTGSGTGSFATTIAANAVDGTMIALGSDATGDIMYYNGTNYVRLAGAAGFLKSTGAAAPAWSAVTKTDVGLSNVPNLSFSGSNTGDQTITLTGPVTGSGTGSFATTIAANATTAGAFYVGATLYINGSLAGESGDPSLCRDPTTGRVGSCSSSLRYKKDITNISDENVEVILEGLDSRLYTLKDGGGQRFGMIAEEANAVNSLLTYNNDQGQVEGIYYDSVTSLLVQGHQIQSRLIGNLSTQLNNSNAAISDLTTSVTNNNSALSSLGLETTTISDNLYNLNTEVFDSDQSLVEGDVVSLVSDSVKKITKSNGDDIETVGVVKKVLDNNQYRVTYGGATSIEVSVTKGQILAGDKLTTSKDYPGKAVRANENTKNIIGIALEPATEDMTIEIILRNDYSPQSASVGTLTSEQSQTLSLFSVGIDGHLIVKGDLEIQGNLKLSGNNRGMNVSIPANSTHVDITFDKARDNNNYSVTVTPSWFTNFAVTQKSASGFRIEFNTTAPANATIDWLVID